MNFDFSLLLVILAALTGAVWLLDSLLLRKPRLRRLRDYLRENGISEGEFAEFAQELQGAKHSRGRSAGSAGAAGAGSPGSGGKEQAGKSPARRRILEQAGQMQRESAPVEYAKSFFPIIFIVLVLRSFLFEPFQIPTGSMIPTLNVGDFIVVNKFAYGLRLPVVGTKIMGVGEPKRGDVMVFTPPHDPNYYIKRVVGLPGDHLRYENKVVYINGEPVGQEYVELLGERFPPVVHSRETLGGLTHDIYTAPTRRFLRPGAWLPAAGRIIPEGHYFMMGDNRDNSSDSREWGPVSEDKVIGKAVAVWMHKEPGLKLPSFSHNRWIRNP